ncbi:MAG: hypothetical protein H6755_00230 [Candidatus Omnitrophica bacterium]|nr:hypothetical protein [Candidatus Omnitrophota bacterium]
MTDTSQESHINLFEQFRYSNKDKRFILQNLKEKVLDKDVEFWNLMVHEYSHYWQTFFYPYIYIASYLQFLALVNSPRQFKDIKEDLEIDKIGFIPKMNTNLYLYSKSFPFYWVGDEIDIGEEACKIRSARWFSINDFVENATSIFHFKFVHAKNPTPDLYFDWVNNPVNKVYKNIYMFLVKKIGKTASFNLLPKLVQLMFRCTDPVPRFCALLNYYMKHHKGEDDLEYKYLKFIAELDNPKEKFDFNLNNLISVDDLPLHYSISNEDFIKCVKSSKGYPLSILALDFLERHNVYGEYEDYFINTDRDKLSFLMRELKPYFVTYHFNDLTENAQPLLELSDNLMDLEFEFPNGDKTTFYTATINYMRTAHTSFEIIRSKSDNSIPHFCILKDCPYHQLKFCRRWINTPRHFEDCSFPHFLKMGFYKRVDIENRMLIHDDSNIDKSIEEFTKFYEKQIEIAQLNYYLVRDVVIFQIPKERLKESPLEYFNRFIVHLINDRNFDLEYLKSNLVLQFMDFNEDPREVFDIPEISNWLRNLFSQVPHLLFFLKVEKPFIEFESSSQFTFILPILIKHQRKDGYFIFEENISRYIVEKHLPHVFEFCTQNKLNGEKICFEIINKLKMLT